MDGRTVLGFLRRMCRDIDEGRPPRRITWGAKLASAAMPAVLGLTVGVASCECGEEDPGAVDLYGAPMRVRDAGGPAPTATDATPPTLPEPAGDGGVIGSDGAPPPPVPTFDSGVAEPLKAPRLPRMIKVPVAAPRDVEVPVVVYGRPFPEDDGPPNSDKLFPRPDTDKQP